MKTKITFFTFVVAMVLAMPTFAQFTPAPDTLLKPGMKQQDPLKMMGKPTFEATSGDLLFSIWIISQVEHKKMMTEMSEKGMHMEMGSMKDKDKEMDAVMDTSGIKDMGMKKDSTNCKDRAMVMDDATKEAMMSGTHHMMVEVKNTANENETNATSAKVEIVSPTNKNSSVNLKTPFLNHFGSGLTLDEKGEYQLTVSVLVGSVSKTIKVKYTVR